MTPLTIIHGEGNGQVAHAAKLTLEDPVHEKMLCRLLRDIEDVRMTVVAVKPLRMGLVRKNRSGYAGPFRLKHDRLDDR